ncbi:uncharacterized protein LOC116143343 [Pistacia vera]|uniref:uncharacterized protein LOC116143343 n=1 Tax=Pistacia vera TaxID=55513 RepID=UPI001263BAB6|nr:uncharacterized protein LOC116143343 [Pistacia vera]
MIKLAGQGKIRALSIEENLELERELASLNKPAVKTIRTIYGDIYDCVDQYKQPSLDHPLLKDHKIQEPSPFGGQQRKNVKSKNQFRKTFSKFYQAMQIYNQAQSQYRSLKDSFTRLYTFGGFVQTDTTIALGMVLETISVVVELNIHPLEINQDKENGKWWLVYGENGKQLGTGQTVCSHI